MDVNARNTVNLKVLRRYEPDTASIVDSTSHVVVYDFDTSSKTWSKKSIEGTLFLIKRSRKPTYAMFVLNRLSTENFAVNLSDDMEVQVLGDYVIFRSENDLVQGLWMYEESDRSRLAASLQKYCSLSSAPDVVVPKPRNVPTETTISVMDLFAKAQATNAAETQHLQPQQQPNNHIMPTPTAIPENGSHTAFTSSAPIPTYQQFQPPQFSLTDLWIWVDRLAAVSGPRCLPEIEFRSRLAFLMQSSPLVDVLYQAYRSNV